MPSEKRKPRSAKSAPAPSTKQSGTARASSPSPKKLTVPAPITCGRCLNQTSQNQTWPGEMDDFDADDYEDDGTEDLPGVEKRGALVRTKTKV
jgi:hypothetical protein